MEQWKYNGEIYSDAAVVDEVKNALLSKLPSQYNTYADVKLIEVSDAGEYIVPLTYLSDDAIRAINSEDNVYAFCAKIDGNHKFVIGRTALHAALDTAANEYIAFERLNLIDDYVQVQDVMDPMDIELI